MIGKELEDGIALDDIEIKLLLSVLKPLYASWLVDLYNYMTSEKGKKLSKTVGNQQVFLKR